MHGCINFRHPSCVVPDHVHLCQFLYLLNKQLVFYSQSEDLLHGGSIMDLGIKPPESLSLTGNMGENLKRFKQKFENFIIAANIEDKDGQRQVAILLHVLGDEALDVYNAAPTLPEGTKVTTKHIFDILEKYCEPRKNTV